MAGVLAGLALGYLVLPFVATVVLMWRHPTSIGMFAFVNYRNGVVCDCVGRPPQESRQELANYLQSVQRLRTQSPTSKSLVLESALTHVRLAAVDQKLNNPSESSEYMRLAQQEFSSLGWVDTSPARLLDVVQAWDAQWKPAAKKASR